MIMKERGKYNLRKRILTYGMYCMASFLIPNILLFDLYNRNHVNSILIFSHVILVAVLLFVTGFFLFIIFKCVVGSVEGALLLAMYFWLSFWLFGGIQRMVQSLSIPLNPISLIALMLMGIIIIAVVFRRYKPPFHKIRPAFNVLVICIITIFTLNVAPAVNHEVTIVRARNQLNEQQVEGGLYLKREFNVESDLPKPDIYWFHMDGMVSIEMLDYFWGTSNDYLREELYQRGFVIYNDAKLNASNTMIAIAALFSPAFYDSFYGERMVSVENKLTEERVLAMNTEMAQMGLTYADDIIPYFELFVALLAGGYEIINTRPHSGVMPNSFEHLTGNQSFITRQWEGLLRGGLMELISLTTPISLPLENIEQVPLMRSHLEGDPEPLARFVWIANVDAHMLDLALRVDPTVTERDPTRYDLYPLGFERAAQFMIMKIDEILERNPHAVIVIQSDHGIHVQSTQQYMLDQGYSLDQVLDLAHSVFSAVRIPDEYGGIEAPIAPLNITRELVNRFVGENYELLP